MPHSPRSRDRLDDDHMTAEVLWREREGERMRERERGVKNQAGMERF